MSVEVTQADREAVAEVYSAMGGPDIRAQKYLSGDFDQGCIVQALARHRIEAERGALERAAQVADKHDGYSCVCGSIIGG